MASDARIEELRTTIIRLQGDLSEAREAIDDGQWSYQGGVDAERQRCVEAINALPRTGYKNDDRETIYLGDALAAVEETTP